MIKMFYEDEYQYMYVDNESASLDSQIGQGQDLLQVYVMIHL